MNKYQNANTTGDYAYIAIELNYNKILKHETEVLRDKDQEELHQMRVGMRRLRSVISGLALALKLPGAAGEKKVGRIAKILGELRDLDVLEETLKLQSKVLTKEEEKKEIQRALKYLKKKRLAVFKKVEKTIQGSDYKELKESFQSWLDKPQYQLPAQWKMQDIVPDLLLPQVSRLLLHQAWLVGTNNREGEITVNNILESKEVEEILETQGPLVHDLRKEAKRTRYLMEIFPQFYDEKYKTYLGDVKTIQTILGEIQDSFVLGNFLTEVFTQDFRQTMPNLADQLTTNRYNKWQEWQQLQQKLLSPQTRQDFHKTILHPLAANIVAETVTKEEP